ncbi:MAG: YkgJ family cysteine cluster protein [Clostridium sp.]
MLKPENIAKEFEKREDEFYDFRSYLKMNAHEDELDADFARLHEEVFSEYDCSKCRNCCKEFTGTFTGGEMGRAAKVLGVDKKDFVEKYIDKADGEFVAKGTPCCLLDAEKGCCIIDECKPQTCKEFPFTNQKERLFSLASTVSYAGICPAVFEILERLMGEYGYRRRKRRW